MATRPNARTADDLPCVTASNLVRNFGEWQDRALGEPVYILHRGRPKLALASIDFLSRLTRNIGNGDDSGALIEAFDEPVLMFDDEGRIARRNRAATEYFGLAAGTGGFGQATDRPLESAVLQLARRVATHRIAERIDAALSHDGERRVEASASPVGTDVLVVIRDLSVREAHARSTALVEATATAIDHHERLATARLNQRGHVAQPSLSLARMTGIPADQLGTTRFSTLFSVQSRVAVGDAIERVLRGGETERIDGELIVDGSKGRTVSLTLSAIVTRLGVEGAIAVVTARPGD
jgi:PAS domain-containing protein